MPKVKKIFKHNVDFLSTNEFQNIFYIDFYICSRHLTCKK